MPDYSREQALPDLERCIRFLKGLESTWTGAKKGTVIIERLVAQSSADAECQFTPDYLDENEIMWAQILGTELYDFGEVSL